MKTPKASRPDEAEIQRQIAADPDDFEPTDEELAAARPLAEALPDLAESIRRSRGRPKSPRGAKQAVTLRLDPDTVARFEALGEGWRTRMAEVLDKAKV